MNPDTSTPAYYKVWFDATDPLALFSQEEDLRGVDRWLVYKGARVERWPEEITFVVEGEHAEDYLFSALHGWLLISERARRVFEECAISGVQFLPVRVIRKEQQVEIGPYWVLNVLHLVEALDWDHTRWLHPERRHEDEHPILDIVKESLKLGSLRGIDIFRLKVKEDAGSIYISHKLKTCLERAGAISGFKFIPVQVYPS